MIAYDLSYGSNYKCDENYVYQSADNTLTEYCLIYSNDNSLTWSHGQGACISLGYSMAVIDNQEKQAYFYEHANLMLVCNNSKSFYYYYYYYYCYCTTSVLTMKR